MLHSCLVMLMIKAFLIGCFSTFTVRFNGVVSLFHLSTVPQILQFFEERLSDL